MIIAATALTATPLTFGGLNTAAKGGRPIDGPRKQVLAALPDPTSKSTPQLDSARKALTAVKALASQRSAAGGLAGLRSESAPDQFASQRRDAIRKAALEKLAQLKAKLKSLMMFGGDPKTRAKMAADIAKEIGKAARDYASAGGPSTSASAKAAAAGGGGAPAAMGTAVAEAAATQSVSAAAPAAPTEGGAGSSGSAAPAAGSAAATDGVAAACGRSPECFNRRLCGTLGKRCCVHRAWPLRRPDRQRQPAAWQPMRPQPQQPPLMRRPRRAVPVHRAWPLRRPDRQRQPAAWQPMRPQPRAPQRPLPRCSRRAVLVHRARLLRRPDRQLQPAAWQPLRQVLPLPAVQPAPHQPTPATTPSSRRPEIWRGRQRLSSRPPSASRTASSRRPM